MEVNLVLSIDSSRCVLATSLESSVSRSQKQIGTQ